MATTKLLFIHGRPAVGKLTIGRTIASLTGAALVDNHVLIDFAKSVIPFGAPGFFELVRASRILALEHAGRAGVPILIFTSCYSEPHDREQLESMESILAVRGGALLPVHLTCSEDVQAARVGSDDRAQRRKLTTVEGLREFEQEWNFAPVPRPDCFTLDTTDSSPLEVARSIIAHYGIAVA